MPGWDLQFGSIFNLKIHNDNGPLGIRKDSKGAFHREAGGCCKPRNLTVINVHNGISAAALE